MTSALYDAIVIGVGGMGSATVYHLAKSGARVLGLERFDVPHSFGSSHGLTRIIRLAYSEGSHYVPLLREAYRLWRELEEVSGESILRVTGGLDIGPETGGMVQGSRKSCVEHDLPFEELDSSDVNRRFPGYRLPPEMYAIYQPDGGYLHCETAIRVHAAAARALGAEIATGVRVLRWERSPTGLRVETDHGCYEAGKLVITAGSWVGGLLPALGPVCRPVRQVMLWTDPLDPPGFEPERFPVFVLEGPFGNFYGFPDNQGEGFKIGKFHHLRQEVSDPDRMDRECHPEDEAVLREGIEAYFPAANGPVRRMTACMFTNSPDGHFILDRHPGNDGRVHRRRVLRTRLQVLQCGRAHHGGLLPGTAAKVGPESIPADAAASFEARAFSVGPRRDGIAAMRRPQAAAGLTACGETHAAFDRRCIPSEPLRCAPFFVAFQSKYTRYSSFMRLVRRTPTGRTGPRQPRRSREFHHRLLTACGETQMAQFSRWGLERRCIPAEPNPPHRENWRFAALGVAFRSKYTRASSPGGGSSLTRLVSRAPRRSRRSPGFHHRLLSGRPPESAR